MRGDCYSQAVPTLGTVWPLPRRSSLPTSFAAVPLGFFHCAFKPDVACVCVCVPSPELSLTLLQPPRQVGAAPTPRSQNSFPLGKPPNPVTHPAAPWVPNGRARPRRRMRRENLGVRRSGVYMGERWEVPSLLGPHLLPGAPRLSGSTCRGVLSPWGSARVWRSSCETH